MNSKHILSVLFLFTFSASEKTFSALPQQHSTSMFKSEKAESEYLQAYDATLKLWDTPIEEADVKTSFGIAHVIISGAKDAPAMVLLHGINASSTMWYPNVKALSQQYRVYAIDLIEEPGKSVSEEVINTREDIVKWYNEVFDHFKLKKISLVGASRGGWLAMALALHSTRIQKVVLLSPAQAITAIKVKHNILYDLFDVMFPKKKRLKKSLEIFSYNVDRIADAFKNQYYIATQKAKKNTSLLAMTPFTDKELKALRIPVLLLVGDHDIINDQKSLDRAKELMPNVKTGTIKDAGHFLSFDQPEIINNKILAFLDSKK